MRLTIIPSDGTVSIDSKAISDLDLTTCAIPEEVHALQWFEDKGWIEFADPVDPFGSKKANEALMALPAWASSCVAVWEAWTPPAPYVPPPEEPVPPPIPVTTIE